MNQAIANDPITDIKKLLGINIADAIDESKTPPDFIYPYRKGEYHIFSNAPFETVYTENKIISVIDEFKESRAETRYRLPGIIFAESYNDENGTLVGKLINISFSAISIKPDHFPPISNSVWKLNINLGELKFDITGNIVRKDDNSLIFVFIEPSDDLKHFLQNLKEYKR